MKKRSGMTLLFAGVFLLGIIWTVLYCARSVKGEAEIQEEQLEEQREKIRLIYEEDYQDTVEKRLEQEKQKGNYTEEHIFMEYNPFGTNTQSLYVYFSTEVPASISYRVSVEDDHISDFERIVTGNETYETVHEFQVIGLIPNELNRITIQVKKENGEEKEYTYFYEMGDLLGEEEIQLEVTQNESEVADGLYVILGNDSDGLDFMYYYDNNGILRGEIPLIGYRSHRLLFQEDQMFYSISQTKIAAVNSLGKVEKVYDTGEYELHHDYVFDSQGNLLILATDPDSGTEEDQIIKINTESGEVEWSLDLGSLLENYKEQCVKTEGEGLDWMHANTIQWIGEETILISSRETSSILKISQIYSKPQLDFIIGEESFWEGTGYEDLLLEKDCSNGEFSNTGGQHTVTYEPDPNLKDGEYYLYMFNNNMGVSTTNPDYDWSMIQGMETSSAEGNTSYYYKYKVDETTKTYTLVKAFQVPFSAYVSSAQEYKGNILINSGMKGIFGEYDSEGNLLLQFQMNLSKNYIYRVYKYDFAGYY